MNDEVAIVKMDMSSKGGLEKYTERLINAFRERKISVTLISASSHDALLPTHLISIPKKPRFLRLKRFDDLTFHHLQEKSYPIIFGMERTRYQTHIRAGNGVHAAYLRSKGASFLKDIYYRLSPFHRKLLEIEKEAFESPHLRKLFCNSHMVKNEILTYYKTDPKKIQVIHNGVEWDEKKEAFEQSFPLKNERFEILFIGHGFERKGLKPLLKALSLIQKEFHLSVVGKDRRLNSYQSLVKRYGLANRVSFYGKQSDVTPFYQRADLVTIPSYYDPFANVTLEALSMGVPVITTRQNGAHEILSKEQGWTISHPSSIDELSSALNEAMKLPKEKMRARSIRMSVQEFDFSKKLKAMVDSTLYE